MLKMALYRDKFAFTGGTIVVTKPQQLLCVTVVHTLYTGSKTCHYVIHVTVELDRTFIYDRSKLNPVMQACFHLISNRNCFKFFGSSYSTYVLNLYD